MNINKLARLSSLLVISLLVCHIGPGYAYLFVSNIKLFSPLRLSSRQANLNRASGGLARPADCTYFAGAMTALLPGLITFHCDGSPPSLAMSAATGVKALSSGGLTGLSATAVLPSASAAPLIMSILSNRYVE